MHLSARSQVCLSVTLLLLTVAFYTSVYLRQPSRDSRGFPSDLGEQSFHETHNVALFLNPKAHAQRESKTIHYTWNITSGIHAPDGVAKRVYLINGKFPGPLVEARSGDEIIVNAYNGLEGDEGIAIHWHGLSMRGANDMDGSVGLTQRAIAPTECFTYKFRIQDDQSGTFWYHAHSELQRADGLYGGLIIYPHSTSLVQNYDDDLALLIGDWYHRSAEEVREYYTDWTNFGIEVSEFPREIREMIANAYQPAPDSILINGQGYFNCLMAVPARPLECKHVTVPQLQLNGKRTRLRIVNTGALTGFTLSFSGFSMTVIKIDGGNDVSDAPIATSVGILYPGERMDVIVERIDNSKDTHGILIVTLDPENMKFKNFALTATQHFPISYTDKPNIARTTPQGSQILNPFFSLTNATGPNLPANSFPNVVDQTFLLYTKISILSEFKNIPKGFINRTSWEYRPSNSTPLLALNRTEWKDQFIPWVKPENQWVDIVLNNVDDKGHPFHLHGNSFYILSTHKATLSSYDVYNPFDPTSVPAGGPMNTHNPLRKDTVFIPRKGYVILRFRADNEGLWLFHCHVLWHHAVGMAMAFQISGNEMGFRELNGEDELAGSQKFNRGLN